MEAGGGGGGGGGGGDYKLYTQCARLTQFSHTHCNLQPIKSTQVLRSESIFRQIY